ncbi:Theileria-specific sub-telomeric protein, SVSP family member, putative [Theileria annulata]|uniref:Theileria-specific sub-telomeric protein, SVSP family member, putative n=1 Tax=Theileria annulata TaxID=5874 RepID=Q4U8D2_THEAN|nr:Theileria-specific sub-telomeric protein, SVSP family member, putative [Theileria annulata]CAI76921.1 Theileria-specific sub-telomeric protein, SVSP family member, putative [Theileria annulata]|eukprot:XP_953546.1 Theileria-specific sub-telomeric protein, SVSP family member, putative [Theileria annulata]
MYICFAYTYTLILLLIGYSGCSDKPTNTQGSNSNEDNLPKIGGLSLVDYSDSDDEDNFQVTETQEEQTEEITEVLDETQTEQETTQIETQPEPETTQTQTETQTEPVKDVETQTDLEQPEPQTEPEPDDNQIKEKLHVLYYVPPPQEPYGIYQQIVAIPPIKPLPPPVPGESPKYYLISAEQNKYGEHETIPVTYMEYKPILQPVLYYEPIIGPQTYPPMQYPSVSYPVVIPPPIQPTQLPTITKESPQQPSQQPSQETSQETSQPETPQQPTRIPRQPTRIPRQRTHPKEHKPIHPNIRPRIKILRRPTQPIQSKEPTKQDSKAATEPSQTMEPSQQSSKEPSTEEPTQEDSKDSSLEPTQSTEESTHEPTHTEEPRQPEPTQEPTEEPTQTTQHTTQIEPIKPTSEPEQLEPETIPVEIGSDEDEEHGGEEPPKEPTESPSGPGDADQPPDKSDEPGGAGGDEDEEDQPEEPEEEKEPPKDLKKCKEVKFMKMNEEGNLIPMSEGDYEIKYENFYVTKYEFLANLEEIHCDGKPIFIHKHSSPYTKLITHNICDDSFILLIGDNFVTLSLGKKNWSSLTYQIPNFIKLYKHDSEGNLVEMNREEYIIDFKLKHSFKYIMRKNISCIKVQVANIVAWEKTKNDTDLCGFSISSLNSVVLRFHKYTRVVNKKNGTYKTSFTKSKKK